MHTHERHKLRYYHTDDKAQQGAAVAHTVPVKTAPNYQGQRVAQCVPPACVRTGASPPAPEISWPRGGSSAGNGGDGARSRVGEQLARWRNWHGDWPPKLYGASARPTPVGRKKPPGGALGWKRAAWGGEAKQKVQHPAFPRGPPPQYCLDLTPLDCAAQMGSG